MLAQAYELSSLNINANSNSLVLSDGKYFDCIIYIFLSFDWLGHSFPLNNFRSLKLGIVPGPTASLGSCQPLVYNVTSFSWNDKRSRQGKESSVLTRSCLSPLGGASTPGYGLTFEVENVLIVSSVSELLNFIGCSWERCIFTILKEWIIHHYVLHYLLARLSLIWKLWACKFL